MSRKLNQLFFTRDALSIGQGQPYRFPTIFGTRRILSRFCFGMALALAVSFPISAQEATDDNEDTQESNSDAGYRYLLMEVSTSVNSKGLKTTRRHNRIEIEKVHAVDAIGDVSVPYNAFRSEARVVKAFTQTADGRTVQLKKEAVRDLTPDEVSSCQMYTDVHQLTFSMPALSKGAIMDYEVEIEETKPVMPGDFWISEYLGGGVEVCTSRVTVVFPAKRQVRLVTTNLTAQTMFEDTTNGNMRKLKWETRNLPALEYEPGMPPYSSVRPQVHLTSVSSWRQVEEWYENLAKKHLSADGEIQAQARQLISGLTNQLDQIQALYRYASRDVRYVGVELGRTAYEPHSPRETLQNKYGDCKDKAVLLVSMLKAVGIQAYLAIVRPNADGPVIQSLPSPAQFNHAIVYLPREKGDLWIDATQPFGEVTETGYHLDDIDALVIGLAGKTFVHIPVPDETHSVHRLIFDLDVHYGGLCTIHESQEFAGRAAISERERRSRLDADKVRKQLEHNLGAGNGYCRLLNYSFTTNDNGPVRVITEYDSDTFLTPTKTGLSVRFDGADLRSWLEVPRPNPMSVRKRKRLYPWVERMAHTEEIICRLHLAEGYALARTPPETHKELPHGKAEMVFNKSDGIPCLTLRIIRQPAELQPGELAEVAQQVDRALSSIHTSIDVEETANELFREHRYAKAGAPILAAAQRDTNSIDAIIRLGLYYKAVGRVYQSRLAFEKAVSLAPQDPRGYEMLADTYSGLWGFPGEGFDRKTIMAVYDRALINVPVRAWTLHRKAAVCLISDFGRPDSTNHIDEAEGYFREILKEEPQSYRGLFGLGQVNRLRGNYDKAEDYYRKAARVKPNQVETRAGIWVSMAFAGRDEEAWNAISTYYGAGQQMSGEVVRVASMLTLSRHYEAAAKLYDRLIESAPRPEIAQKFGRLMRKTEKVKRDNYENFYDDSTPESAAQTLLLAGLMGDTNKVFRCLSPAVNREQARQLLKDQTSHLSSIITKVDFNYLGDIMLSVFDVSKRKLDNGDVEVKLDASKSAVAAYSPFGTVVTLQMQQAGNHWQAVTMDAVELDCATFGRLAIDALDGGDTARAVAWQARLADLASRAHAARARNTPRLAEHLQQIAFTNDVLKAKAWGGMGLVGSHDRADIARGARCLEDVVAAYPDVPQLKMALAYAENQLAHVLKAAAILDTIDISKIAAPDALGDLARLQLRFENLEAADKTLARLQKVAPDDDRLLPLEAFALIYRAKHAEATAAFARLRDRSKLYSLFSIPDECMAISLSGNQQAMRDFVDYWREPEKPITTYRPSSGNACLGLDLIEEASEQIATMLAEGGMNPDALVSYAEVALARGDIPEARHLISVADRIANQSIEPEHHRSFASVHLALGDNVEAARIYRDSGSRFVTHYSAYSLCMSALASRLAGDTTTAAETLKLAAAVQGDSEWPRLAIQYVNGDISEEEFRRAPERTTATPCMHTSRECEVNCIVALVKESKHDLPGALAAYKACLDTKSVTDLEYNIARFAMQRLRGPQSQTSEGNSAGDRSTSNRL